MGARRPIVTDRRCAGCGLRLTMAQRHYAELSHGFVKVRQQGVHSVTMPEYTGRFYCELCLGKNSRQLALFGDDDDG